MKISSLIVCVYAMKRSGLLATREKNFLSPQTSPSRHMQRAISLLAEVINSCLLLVHHVLRSTKI